MSNAAAVTLEQVAVNPQALENLTDDQIDALAGVNATTATESTATPGESTSSETPAAAVQAGTATPEPKGVQAKDGDHVIPYSVLERERERAARAEATATALADEIAQLRAGKTPTATTEAPAILSDEDLEQLDQDLPGVAKAIRAQMAMIEDLTGTVKTLKAGQEVTAQTAEQARADEEEAAIAASETLSALRSASTSDPKANARWNKAVDLYSTLREDPEFFGLSTSELIAKAEASLTAMYGPLTPAAPAPAATPAAKPAAAASPATPAQLQAKADAAIAAADKSGTAVPRSLGDIPGGSAPLVDEAAAILSMSGPELTASFMTMTPEQIEAKLSRLR